MQSLSRTGVRYKGSKRERGFKVSIGSITENEILSTLSVFNLKGKGISPAEFMEKQDN